MSTPLSTSITWQTGEELLGLCQPWKNVTALQSRLANSIARQSGYGTATSIVFGNQNRVLSHTPYGWRKKSTGQYVPQSYRARFGWKNTYYQSAETIVEIAVEQKGH